MVRNEMIPKKIHYCWFGNGKMPQLANICIESWKNFLPDYKLKLWNESNFDVSQNRYTAEAYKSKKYAFVTDYVRLYALYNEGGIYMDTDVEVLKNMDRFLNLPAFTGFESDTFVPTGIIGSEPKGIWVKEQLEYYYENGFLKADGSIDTTTNVHIITNSMKREGFILNNTQQNFKNKITIFPSEYFCPKSYETGNITITDNTYCIHHFSESWMSKSKKRKKYLSKFMGKRITQLLVKIKKSLSNHPFGS